MSENPNQPGEYDAVLGGQNPQLANAVVLGGIEGVKTRLASPSETARIAALSDALKYGEKGLDILFETVKTETGTVQNAARKLLWQRAIETGQQKLLNYLPTYTFDIITVDNRGREINRVPSTARLFPEDLGNGVILQMVSIPAGEFLMGSPETEWKRRSSESPQHSVTVPPFFMSKYPITQAQWQAVAALSEINIPLDPDEHSFTGANLPFMGVLWRYAIEFCARLSQKTGRHYRLPSEAEWEYACRAGTTTPFHFGETITSDLANYRAFGDYAYESLGDYRKRTTDVGIFPSNAFGLHDMHGNVWEWCADSWHYNYNGAPNDGSVWKSGKNNKYRVMRGGSWYHLPSYCRSAYRLRSDADCDLPGMFGLRVVCANPPSPSRNL